MNIKDTKTELANRLELVNRRVIALQIELTELTEEQVLLEGLVKVYDKRKYDSIEDERRVTLKISNTACSRNGLYDKILNALDSGPATKEELMNFLGCNKRQINNAIWCLTNKNQKLVLTDGKYSLKESE